MEKMKKYKILSTVVAVILTASMAAGCGTQKQASGTPSGQTSAAGQTQAAGTSEAPKEKVTLQYMTWAAGDEMKNQEGAIKDYMDKNPNIEVKSQFVKYEEYGSKLNTLIAADSAPDVFYIEEYLAIDWGEKGVATDLKPLFDKAGIDPNEKWLKPALFQSQGKVWGVADGLAAMLLYYNKDLFTKAGVEFPSQDPLKPWTWQQFVDAAKKLTTDSAGKHPGEAGFNDKAIKTFGTMAPTFWLFNMAFLYSNNAAYGSEDGMSLAADKPEALEVFQAIADLMNKDHVAPTVATSKGLPGAVQMMKNGQLAMEISGTWEFGTFMTEKMDIGVAPLPMFKKPVDVSWASANLISAKSKHIDEAFNFLLFFTDYDTNISQLKTNIPGIKAWYEPDKMKLWTEDDQHNEDFKTVIPRIMTSDTLVIPENVMLKDFGKIVSQTINPTLDKLWLGQASVEEVAKEYAEKTKGMFKGRWGN
jgi:multiple sugar transport system substrate-binding protein